MTVDSGEIGLPARRYDGRIEHADWCSDHSHDGLCLDFLTGWEPAPEQVKRPLEAVLAEYGYRIIGRGMHGDTHYFHAEKSTAPSGRNDLA